MKKEIAILTTYPLYSEPVIRNRLTIFARIFSEKGWNVKILTCSPAHEREERSNDDVFEVVHVKVPPFDRTKFLSRMIFEFYYVMRLFLTARKLGVGCVLVSVPSMFFLLLPFRGISKFYIIDVRDLVWKYLQKKNALLKVLGLVFEFFARNAIKTADLTLVTNYSEQGYMKSIISESQLLVVSNGVSREQFQKLSSIKYLVSCSKKMKVVYIGNIGIAQNLEVLVKALANHPFIELDIVGDGTDFSRVQDVFNSLGARNISLVGRVPWERVVNYYANADVLYTQLSDQFESAVPSKLYEYLSTGLPIVYGGGGAAAKFLASFSGIHLVDANNVEQLKGVFETIFRARSDKKQLFGDNIKKIENSYLREEHALLLEERMQVLAVELEND